MLKLKTEISSKQGVALNRDIKEYIQRRPKVMCKAINGRPVFLTKFLEATHGRLDRTRRRQSFFSGVDLLRTVKPEDMSNQFKAFSGELSFEFQGITPKGEVVGAHVREEIEGKNRRLYLISTFPKGKPAG